MANSFKNLRNNMSPKAQNLALIKTKKILEEMRLKRLKQERRKIR